MPAYKVHMRRRGDCKVKRRGTCALWLKRNWVLLSFATLGIVGVLLSILLLFEPCDKKTETSVLNTTLSSNVTVYTNITVNTTINVTRNVTSTVLIHQPVDAIVNLDSSGSMNEVEWLEQIDVAQTMLGTMRSQVNSSMQVAFAQWATNGEVEVQLTKAETYDFIENITMERQARCINVSYYEPWIASANQVSALCLSMMDYDARFKWARMDYTYYAQALLNCIEEVETRRQDQSYQLCIVITDGILTEDNYGVIYTEEMAGDRDALYYFHATPTASHAYQWISGGAYAYCERTGLLDPSSNSCTIDDIATHMKTTMNITIVNIMVGHFTANSQARMAGLSSCDGMTDFSDCIYMARVDDFVELRANANAISKELSSTIGTRTVVELVSIIEEEILSESNIEANEEVQIDFIQGFSQRKVCTGSGVSFAFLLLGLPFLVYLFFKPIANILENLCCPIDLEAHADINDQDSVIHMETNPAFGVMEKLKFEEDSKKKRSEIDKKLRKARHKKKKKEIDGLEELGVIESDKNAANDMSEIPLDAADYGTFEFVVRPGQQTAWSNGLFKVYDGDDWQEHTFDYVTSIVTRKRLQVAAATVASPQYA